MRKVFVDRFRGIHRFTPTRPNWIFGGLNSRMASGQHSYYELALATLELSTTQPRRVILFMGAMRLLV